MKKAAKDMPHKLRNAVHKAAKKAVKKTGYESVAEKKDETEINHLKKKAHKIHKEEHKAKAKAAHEHTKLQEDLSHAERVAKNAGEKIIASLPAHEQKMAE